MRLTQILLGIVLSGALACGPRIAAKNPSTARVPVTLIEKGDRLFAHQGARRWLVADTDQRRLVISPDRKRFAYLSLAKSRSQTNTAVVGFVAERHSYRVVVKNADGTTQGRFSAVGAQRPDGLSWVDNQRIGYLTAADHRGRLFVIHRIASGEISERIQGHNHIWCPAEKRVAYVEGQDSQRVRVGPTRIWPRGVVVPQNRKIIGDVVWSPDGEGLAFIERRGSRVRLVVLLALDDAGGDMTWSLPASDDMDTNRIFWAKSRVIVGKSPLNPRFAAGWKRVE